MNKHSNTKLPTNGSRIKHDPTVSQLYQAITFTNTRWTQPMQRYYKPNNTTVLGDDTVFNRE